MPSIFPISKFFVALFALLIAGCVVQLPVPPAETSEQSCQQWLDQLDGAVTKKDAQYTRVLGQAWLRTDRFLASFKQQSMEDHARHYWFQMMVEKGKEGFTNELLVAEGVGENLDVQQLHHCIDLVARQFFPTQFRPLWNDSQHAPKEGDKESSGSAPIQVKDHYSGLKRALGLYPVIKGAAMGGILDYQAETKQRMAAFDPQAVRATNTYGFKQSQKLSPEEVGELFKAAYQQSPLAIPQLDDVDLKLMFERHAPKIKVEQQHEDDRMGRVVSNANQVFTVDPAQPLVYTFPSFTRFRGENLLQLNYGFWFPSRPSDDVYGGFLDGIIWRVTLNKKGEVLLYDSIHQCGCYHKYFVPKQWQSELEVVPWNKKIEPPMVFYIDDTGLRPQLHINSVEHYILKVDAYKSHESLVPYELQDYNKLARLPQADGFASLFASDGLVPSSKRTERFYFWPLGIKSAGAMRQKGTHAIAFVGRQHFDDADLLEQIFGR